MDDSRLKFAIIVFGTIIATRLVVGLFVTNPAFVLVAMVVAGVLAIPFAYLYTSRADPDSIDE